PAFAHSTPSKGSNPVSETAVTDAGENDPRHESRDGRNIFQRIALFVRQVISELRRVVTPTREELMRYIWVVLAFVGVMMLIVFGYDAFATWLADLTFGG